jgi:hypothetical protein
MEARVTLSLLARLEERRTAEVQLRGMCQMHGQPGFVPD